MSPQNTEQTVEFLIDYAHKFRKEFNWFTITNDLNSDDPKSRANSSIFSVYHFLVAGAVAEDNIQKFIEDKSFPDITSEYTDYIDTEINIKAFKGTAFENTPNIIGSLSFLFVILFLFEGFCKIILFDICGKKPPSQDPSLSTLIGNYLQNEELITKEKLETITFLIYFRNAWHTFGVYNARGKNSPKKITCHDYRIINGKRLPVIKEKDRLLFLRDLLDVYLEVNALRKLQ